MSSFIKRFYHRVDCVLQACCSLLPGPLLHLVKRMHRMMTYAFLGFINTAVDYIVFYLLYRLIGVPIEWSQAAAYISAAAHGYILNSNLTFTEGKGRTRGQMIQYIGVDVILVILSSYFMGWIEHFEIPLFLVKLGMAVVTGLFHYVIYKFLVFRIKKEDKQ